MIKSIYMKTIFFSLEPPSGSYGGGAFFVKNMIKYLQKNGFNITFRLIPDIDLIFVIDPRKDRYNHYSIEEIMQYKNFFPMLLESQILDLRKHALQRIHIYHINFDAMHLLLLNRESQNALSLSYY